VKQYPQESHTHAFYVSRFGMALAILVDLDPPSGELPAADQS